MASSVANQASLSSKPRAPVFVDDSIAVYRPWVWITMPISSGLRFSINYPLGIDNKFRWLKDFTWEFGGNRGEYFQFTVFEERGDVNAVWLDVIQRVVANQGAPEVGYVNFQWGWASRNLNNGTLNQGDDPFPQNLTYTSDVHSCNMTYVDMEYVEGGINYRFTGHDILANTGVNKVFPEHIPNMGFENAIKTLEEILKKQKVVHPSFEFIITQEFKDSFDVKTEKDKWPINGSPILLAIQSWLGILNPVNKGGKINKGPIIATQSLSAAPGGLSVVFKVSQSDIYLFGSDIIIDVNPPDTLQGAGIGRHTAISIKPSFAGLQIPYPAFNGASQDKVVRTINRTSDEGTLDEQANVGPASALASPAPDSTDNSKTSIIQKEQFSQMINQAGSHFKPEQVQIELLGIPSLNSMDILTKIVKMQIWNPAYISSGNGDPFAASSEGIKWRRQPPFDPRYPFEWIVNHVSHNMNSEGAYTTTLTLTPRNPGDQPLASSGQTGN